MNKEEKICLIQCLLEDVRGNWADDTAPRVNKAKELCEELGGDFLRLADCCKEYMEKVYGKTYEDGRFFRDDFPYGYVGMESLYSISHNLKDKSEEFQKIANDLLTYPEYRFDDVRG